MVIYPISTQLPYAKRHNLIPRVVRGRMPFRNTWPTYVWYEVLLYITTRGDFARARTQDIEKAMELESSNPEFLFTAVRTMMERG